jgi:F-box/WD-40 domain protein 10
MLTTKLNNVKTWFLRAGDQSKRRYTLGLIRRLQSVDLVRYVINLLQPLLCKDFTYARMRTKPSLATDQATMSCDRALSPMELEKNIADSWYWFQAANYWTKSNFLLGILQCCDAHLMHAIGTHARTLLASEQKAFIEKGKTFVYQIKYSIQFTLKNVL